MRIKICSITELLAMPESVVDKEEVGILFITIKPNYYHFENASYIYLPIADNDIPKASQATLNKIYYWTKNRQFTLKYFDKLYVCCDAGLRRSPAIALYIAFKLRDKKQMEYIESHYRFLWFELYKYLCEHK